MRLIFTISFLFSVAYGQTNYYVSNSGSDAANGLTPATSWQTLSKVNSFGFASGDTVKLNSGDSWNERLVPNSNIYITSYGTGAKPTITGLQTITGFTQSGNIWTKTVSASAGLNMVLINGQIAHKGRYPNTGYLTYSSKTYSTLSTSLTGTPNYTGAIAVVRTAPWLLDLSTVTSQSGGTLNLSPNLTYNTPLFSNGFFLQGLASLVDTTNEYSYDGTTLTIYSQTTPVVQVSTIDTLVWLRKKSNVTFSNISFIGANITAFQYDTCSNITVQNCSFNYSGRTALSALKSSQLSVLNDSISNSLSGAIYFLNPSNNEALINQCDSAIIIGNTIKNTGTIAGMGLGGEGKYIAMYITGLNKGPYIANNTIDSTGYSGVLFLGKKSIIRQNVVSNFCYVKDDGGGIYTVGSFTPVDYNDSSTVASNIVYNGIGAPDALHAGAVSGLYFDLGSRRITVDSNTVSNCILASLAINGRQFTARYNNFYNNIVYPAFNPIALSGTSDSMYLAHNAMYSNSNSPLISASSVTTAITSFGTSDSNYYYNPIAGYTLIKYNGVNYTLSAWRTFSSKDLNSSEIPSDLVTSDTKLLLNTSLVPATFDLVSTYINRGVTSDTVTLQPINGAILLKAGYNVFTNKTIRYKKLAQ
jgi:hypothetical protein